MTTPTTVNEIIDYLDTKIRSLMANLDRTTDQYITYNTYLEELVRIKTAYTNRETDLANGVSSYANAQTELLDFQDVVYRDLQAINYLK